MTDLKEQFLNFCGTHRPTEQQQQAIFEKKSVIAAGAGSGKTATLAQRFLWLVINKTPADKILTITFTKDAAASMKSKIFTTLQDALDCKLITEEQLNAFSNATICTTDSFCSEIAKMDCVRYGIPSNFSIEEKESLESVSSGIVDKLLQKYEGNRQLKRYLSFHSIENIKESMQVLADKYICISDPVNTDRIVSFITEKYGLSNIALLEIKLFEKIEDYFNDSSIEKRKVEDDTALSVFKTSYLSDRIGELVKLKKALGGNASAAVKPHRNGIKEVITKLELALCATEKQSMDLLEFIADFINDYQTELLNHKKETGLVTFYDVLKLAIHILKNNENIRAFYNEKFNAIMVDEFQDNNGDNKDLIYLLASTPDYKNNSKPDVSAINKDKIFMVGDEKQSIYMFRNADVSVFKGIAREFGQDSVCNLTRNFRSEKKIIQTIDSLFETILGAGDKPYEAAFTGLYSENENVNPTIAFQYIVEEDSTPDGCLSAIESEAFEVASEINRILTSDKGKYQLPTGDPQPSDIAILLKTGTHQGSYEKALRYFNIPVDVSETKTLTTDAVLNDFYTVLQLAVYGPDDEISKYAYLKSPFCRLTDREIYKDKDNIYSKHSSLIDNLRSFICYHSIAQVVSYIWNNLGYRYFIISSENNRAFEEHFDYIFKLACHFDESNRTVVDLLDYLRPLMGDECKIKDLSIQKENANGVKIMSIHKSKGLEFPIVFVADMQSGSSSPGGFKPNIRLSETGDITLPYCTVGTEDRIRNPLALDDNIDTLLENAETKRIFYVAATRAQYHLIFSGVIPKKGKQDDKFITLDESKQHSQLDYFLNAINFRYEETFEKDRTFGIEMKRFDYHSIKSRTFSSERKTDCDIYANEPKPVEFKKMITAVTEKEEESYESSDVFERFAVEDYLNSKDRSMEFGSFVHKMFENAVLGSNEEVFGFFEGDEHRDELFQCAENLTETFKNNPFISEILRDYKCFPEKPLIINDNGQLKSGVIDLLCVGKDRVIIVDYKTDKVVNPDLHRYQLNTYRKAAESIFNLPVETYLYYIRNNQIVPL